LRGLNKIWSRSSCTWFWSMLSSYWNDWHKYLQCFWRYWAGVMVPIWGVTWLLRWILENPVSQRPRYFSTVEKKDPGVSLS